MISVTIEGLDHLRNAWHTACAQLDDGCDGAVVRAVEEGAEVGRVEHRYVSRTGNLENATQGHMTGRAEGEIVALADYASFVEEGTPPHIIRPKAAIGFNGPLLEGQSRRKRGTGGPRSMLAWMGGDGAMHFASEVHHPGTDPLPFMGPAALKAERVLVREIEGTTVPAMQHTIDSY